MKNINFVFQLIFCILISYLSIAFAVLELNPLDWHQDLRLLLIVSTGAGYIIMYLSKSFIK